MDNFNKWKTDMVTMKLSNTMVGDEVKNFIQRLIEANAKLEPHLLDQYPEGNQLQVIRFHEKELIKSVSSIIETLTEYKKERELMYQSHLNNEVELNETRRTQLIESKNEAQSKEIQCSPEINHFHYEDKNSSPNTHEAVIEEDVSMIVRDQAACSTENQLTNNNSTKSFIGSSMFVEDGAVMVKEGVLETKASASKEYCFSKSSTSHNRELKKSITSTISAPDLPSRMDDGEDWDNMDLETNHQSPASVPSTHYSLTDSSDAETEIISDILSADKHLNPSHNETNSVVTSDETEDFHESYTNVSSVSDQDLTSVTEEKMELPEDAIGNMQNSCMGENDIIVESEANAEILHHNTVEDNSFEVRNCSVTMKKMSDDEIRLHLSGNFARFGEADCSKSDPEDGEYFSDQTESSNGEISSVEPLSDILAWLEDIENRSREFIKISDDVLDKYVLEDSDDFFQNFIKQYTKFSDYKNNQSGTIQEIESLSEHILFDNVSKNEFRTRKQRKPRSNAVDLFLESFDPTFLDNDQIESPVEIDSQHQPKLSCFHTTDKIVTGDYGSDASDFSCSDDSSEEEYNRQNKLKRRKKRTPKKTRSKNDSRSPSPKIPKLVRDVDKELKNLEKEANTFQRRTLECPDMVELNSSESDEKSSEEKKHNPHVTIEKCMDAPSPVCIDLDDSSPESPEITITHETPRDIEFIGRSRKSRVNKSKSGTRTLMQQKIYSDIEKSKSSKAMTGTSNEILECVSEATLTPKVERKSPEKKPTEIQNMDVDELTETSTTDSSTIDFEEDEQSDASNTEVDCVKTEPTSSQSILSVICEEGVTHIPELSKKHVGRRNIRAQKQLPYYLEDTHRNSVQLSLVSSQLYEKNSQLEKFSGLQLQEEPFEVKVDENITAKLKDYQKKGIINLWKSCFLSNQEGGSGGSGCILSHAMGLGKSFQALAFMHTLLVHKELSIKYCLVLCPKTIVCNWKKEYDMWLKDANLPINFHNLFPLSTKFAQAEKELKLKKFLQTGGIALIHYDGFLSFSGSGRGRKEHEKETDQDEDFPHTHNDAKETKSNMLELYKQLIQKIDVLVLDEGHNIKNPKTNLYNVIRSIPTKRKIILTGTPVMNNLSEFYHMIQIVRPEIFRTEAEFNNYFKNPIENGQHFDSYDGDKLLAKKMEAELNKICTGFLYREDSKVLDKFIPPKKEYNIFINLTELQISLYEKYFEEIGRKGDRSTKLLEDLAMFQHICCHPKLLYDKKMEADEKNSKKKNTNDISDDMESMSPPNKQEWFSDLLHDPSDIKKWENSSKLMVLGEIIRQSLILKEKMLIFSKFKISLNIIEAYLASNEGRIYIDNGWTKKKDYYRIDGDTAAMSRNKYCEKFNEDEESKLFLLTTKVGGLGLNLQAATRVVLFDSSMNPVDDEQSVFRVYRLGQTKPTFIYRFASRGGMEEVICCRGIVKESVAGRVVDDQKMARNVASDDFSTWYKFNRNSNPFPNVQGRCSNKSDDLILNAILDNQNGVSNLIAFHIDRQDLLEKQAEEVPKPGRKAAVENRPKRGRPPKLHQGQNNGEPLVVDPSGEGTSSTNQSRPDIYTFADKLELHNNTQEGATQKPEYVGHQGKLDTSREVQTYRSKEESEECATQ